MNPLALILLLLTSAFQRSGPDTVAPEDVAIFAVRQVDRTISIDPVVIVHYGRVQGTRTVPALNSPLPARGWTEKDFDRIEETYYKPGTSVTVFSGGEMAGAAEVLSSQIDGRNGECIDLSATVAYK